jgi:hypothetical protein
MNLPFFIGLWPFVTHFTFGIAGIAGSIMIAIFATELAAIPFIGWIIAPIVSHVRTIAICAAVGIGAALFFYASGARDESKRCVAQFQAVQVQAVKRGTTARTRATGDVSNGVRDPRDTDNQ